LHLCQAHPTECRTPLTWATSSTIPRPRERLTPHTGLRVIPHNRAMPAAREGPLHRRWILAATILGSSMAFIDGTVVNIALPALQDGMGASISDVQWVVEAYTLFLASLMLTGGAMGDRYGRRRVFLLGVGVFTAGSVACGLAPTIGVLIACRGLQGIGAAMMVPGSLAIISASFPDAARGKAIGTWSAFTSITMVIGPLVGGSLIDHASWRAIFFINVPLAGLVAFLTLRYVPESREAKRRPLDLAGALLATTGLAAVVFGLIESSTRGFASPLIWGALAAGAILIALFVVVEWRGRSPMMPLALFGSRAFLGANLLTLFLYAALAGGLFFVPMNLMQVHGFTATSPRASARRTTASAPNDDARAPSDAEHRVASECRTRCDHIARRGGNGGRQNVPEPQGEGRARFRRARSESARRLRSSLLRDAERRCDVRSACAARQGRAHRRPVG